MRVFWLSILINLVTSYCLADSCPDILTKTAFMARPLQIPETFYPDNIIPPVVIRALSPNEISSELAMALKMKLWENTTAFNRNFYIPEQLLTSETRPDTAVYQIFSVLELAKVLNANGMPFTAYELAAPVLKQYVSLEIPSLELKAFYNLLIDHHQLERILRRYPLGDLRSHDYMNGYLKNYRFVIAAYLSYLKSTSQADSLVRFGTNSLQAAKIREYASIYRQNDTRVRIRSRRARRANRSTVPHSFEGRRRLRGGRRSAQNINLVTNTTNANARSPFFEFITRNLISDSSTLYRSSR